MIHLKTPEEIEIIAAAGKIAREALDLTISKAVPGITTMELNNIADEYIVSKGAIPGFKGVDGYTFATCININDGLVHGLPSDYKIRSGDLVSIDLGAKLNGLHSDLSHTIEIETTKYTGFLNVGLKALEAGISMAKVNYRMGDVGNAIQKVVEASGYSVSRDLVGHGVGYDLHEDPYVPGYGNPGRGLVLKEGMVLAVEVIYQIGKPEIALAEDDWTIITADGSLGGLFEHTIAVTSNGPRILTK